MLSTFQSPEGSCFVPESHLTKDRALAGIGLMLAAMLAFSLNDTMGKWLVATYGVAQLLLIRSLAAMLMLAPAIRWVGLRTVLRPQRPWIHALRAFCSVTETALFYWAVVYLPLADTVAFYLASPIFVTILAVIFLKEKVGWRRWLAVTVGFIGVLIAVKPTGEGMGWPALIAISGSLIFAGSNTLTRLLAGENEVTLVSWQAFGNLLFGLAVAPFLWVAPNLRDFGALMLLGIVATFAHMGVNRSLRYAPAAVVIPYQYSLIVWAVILGYLFFGDWPAPNVLIGAGIIVAAGLYIFIREQIRAKAP
jgi:drug/metabolite transporter (DMT)-like permease